MAAGCWARCIIHVLLILQFNLHCEINIFMPQQAMCSTAWTGSIMFSPCLYYVQTTAPWQGRNTGHRVAMPATVAICNYTVHTGKSISVPI